MKVAAYQASLKASQTLSVVDQLHAQVAHCESSGIEILCFPEAVLGGLADYSADPRAAAIDMSRGQLREVLARLASDTVTTIVGFSELDRSGHLFNSAAVFHRGRVLGIYRKHHVAINRTLYSPGEEAPVFTVGGLTFGIIICRDSMFAEPARAMIGKGATALFVPTNNGMPVTRGGSELIVEARNADIARARTYRVSVIRADVAGRAPGLVSYGATGIVDAGGVVLGTARPLTADLVVAEIDTTTRSPNAG